MSSDYIVNLNQNNTPSLLTDDSVTSNTTSGAINFATEMGKTILKTASLVSLDIFLTPKIAHIATNKFGLCLGNFFSKKFLSNLTSIVTPLGKFNSEVSQLLGNKLSNYLVLGTLEEIQFRWLLQGILLRKIPMKVLEQVSPDLAKQLDSLPCKISRVAIVALFFALCHTYALDCSSGGGIYQLAGGLLYGTLFEFTEGSLVDCALLHGLYDFITLG